MTSIGDRCFDKICTEGHGIVKTATVEDKISFQGT